MPENNDPELTTIVPTNDISEIPSIESEVSSTVPDDAPIDGLTRFGPGDIEGLRFKWTVRHVAEGYVVDETIGASISAFSTGPMSRETALAFMDARETEAHQRFESLRQKFFDAQNLGAQAQDRSKYPRPKVEDRRALEVIEAPSGAKQMKSPDIADGNNLDDVMDRIARLLDER